MSLITRNGRFVAILLAPALVATGVLTLLASGCQPTQPSQGPDSSQIPADTSQPLSSLKLSYSTDSDPKTINEYLKQVFLLRTNEVKINYNARVAFGRLTAKKQKAAGMTQHYVDLSNADSETLLRMFYALKVPAPCKTIAGIFESALLEFHKQTDGYATMVKAAGNVDLSAKAPELTKENAATQKDIDAKFAQGEAEMQKLAKQMPGVVMPVAPTHHQ